MPLPSLIDLGLEQPQEENPLGFTSPQQLLGIQPLSFTPPPAPSVPAQQPGAGGDMIAGKPDILAHLQTVMQASASGKLDTGAPKGQAAAETTVKTTDDGMTPEQRASSVAVRGQAAIDQKQIEADRAEQISKDAALHAAKLRAEAQVEDEQRAKAEQENEARQQRIREHQEQLAEQRDEKVNPNRYFENMGTAAKLFAIMSAFSYGYLNPKGQGVAPIIQTLQQAASEDTRAQIANNQEGRARRGDLIALYERRYGDTTLVSKKLDADKLMTLGKKALADAEESKSAQARATAQDLAKGLFIQAGVLNKQVEEAYTAKPVREITTTYKPAAGKGDDSAKRYQQWAAADKALESQGVAPNDPPRVALRAHFGVTATGNTAAEQERTDKQAATEAKAKELTTDEKKDLRERTDGLANAVHGFEELDKVAGISRNKAGEVIHARTDLSDTLSPGITDPIIEGAKAVPWGMGSSIEKMAKRTLPSDSLAMRRAVEKITTGMVHAESGAGANESEMTRAQERFPVTSSREFLRASEEYHREQRQKYLNLAAKYGKENVDADLKARGIDPDRFGG